MSSVLCQATEADLHKSELALDDAERVSNASTDTGLVPP
jgi:hypothetical protein